MIYFIIILYYKSHLLTSEILRFLWAFSPEN
ncbi:hypothetical protein [Klebsiella phage vB_KpnS-VAC51]|uniref:Uncharacterized protein n=1 Tax=Klebsiella phage vB_KpnS-VAC51 TaxID=2866698 RepID=A0AAE9C676_9CAUD|nr:hypothetical protein [Klebsiella phage vB_KpnS-VAC51]